MLDLFFRITLHTLEVIGVLIIIYGVIRVIISFIGTLFNKNISTDDVITEIRLQLSKYLILSLEFFIARDIIETLLNPGIEDIIILVVLVLLRTLLAFFIDYEIRHIQKKQLHKVFKKK